MDCPNREAVCGCISEGAVCRGATRGGTSLSVEEKTSNHSGGLQAGRRLPLS